MRADSPAALRWIVVSLTAASVYVCWPLWPSLVLAAWTGDLTGHGLLVGVGLTSATQGFGPLVIRLWIEALALQSEAVGAASKQS